MFAYFKMWGDTDKVYKGCSLLILHKFPDKITDKMGKICSHRSAAEKGLFEKGLIVYIWYL